jgi:hypothetical protein
MTMLPRTRHGARRLRSGALALTLAAFVPLAIPVTASASTSQAWTPTGNYVSNPQGNVFVNEAKANSLTNLKTVFKVKFELGVGVSPTVSAVNRAEALTSQCADCNAVAIGFQVVTTTVRDITNIHALNVATATNDDCSLTCTAVADAYQVVVATDTPAALTFGQILDIDQLLALYQIRSEFLALPNSGLTLTQIQAKCADLVNQVVTILQDGSYGVPSYTTFTLPSFSPAAHGASAATEPAPGSVPLVNLYKDIQFQPAG